MVYYAKPMHKQDAFANLENDEQDFIVTNELSNIVLSLPMHPYMSEDDVQAVCKVIKKYYNIT